MLERIGRIAIPEKVRLAIFGGIFAVCMMIALGTKKASTPDIKVAFVGNSMIYYNDFPRFMESLSNGHLTQNSCLHGNANLDSILVWGNGMYKIWNSGAARVYSDDATIHDYGACTVKQLLFGYDEELEEKAAAGDDAVYGNNDDFSTYGDGTNPCISDPYYLQWLDNIYAFQGTPQFDYIVLNDNTRSPARTDTRARSLEVLENVYADWIIETGATPVLLMTYGYSTPYRDMGGLDDVPKFTSLTYEGYRQYAELLESLLPAAQKPRIAPVGEFMCGPATGLQSYFLDGIAR